jgi:hypothetical protein
MDDQAPPALRPRLSGLSVAGLVLGILGFLCGLIGIPAFICGIIATIQISKSRGKLEGLGVAIMGVILGLMTPILFYTVIQTKVGAPNARCAANMNEIGLAIGVYADDHEGRIPREFNDLRQYLPRLDEALICPWARDTNHPSYKIVLGGKRWNTQETTNAIVVIETEMNHHGRRNALYGDGRVGELSD